MGSKLLMFAIAAIERRLHGKSTAKKERESCMVYAMSKTDHIIDLGERNCTKYNVNEAYCRVEADRSAQFSLGG